MAKTYGVMGTQARRFPSRSANLVDWEDWRTVTLDGTGCELIDETTGASQRFYRAVEDNSVATK